MKKYSICACMCGMLVLSGCKTSEAVQDNNQNVPAHHEENNHHEDDHASHIGKCGHTLTYVSVSESYMSEVSSISLGLYNQFPFI